MPDVCEQMVDVWATGITLYMMLVGRVPFWAETVPEIYEKILVRAQFPLALSRSAHVPVVESYEGGGGGSGPAHSAPPLVSIEENTY